jgi:hypothetical protein
MDRDLKLIAYSIHRFFISPASLCCLAVDCFLIIVTFGFSQHVDPGFTLFVGSWCGLMVEWGVAFGLTGLIGGVSVGRPRYFAHAAAGSLSFLVGAAVGAALWIRKLQTLESESMNLFLMGALSPFLIGGVLFGIAVWLLQTGAESHEKSPRK